VTNFPPPYRLSTVEPVSREDVISAFGHVIEGEIHSGLVLDLADGSKIVFHASSAPGHYFTEFRIQFFAGTEGGLLFGILPAVIQFCKVHGGHVKALRNGSVLPASGGVMSDVYWSEAFRKASHMAYHPRDRKT
jgi:hypothetical protein